MSDTPSVHSIRNKPHAILLYLALICAGLAGNYFPFSILNAHYIFGSIFAMLALQIFGWGRGVLAAAIISGCTYLTWNHPWAVVTMTTEVAVVGWLIRRRKINLVAADAVYWFFIGIPIGYIGFHIVSNFPISNTLFLLTKQAINGVANALIARLIFMGCSLRSTTTRMSFHEVVSNLLLFFVLCPSLILLTISGRTDMAETDREIRSTLIRDSRQVTESLKSWLDDREKTVVTLAGMATSLSAAQMQSRLEQAKDSDINFLRIALIDKAAIAVAYAPPADELGRTNIGKSFADRPYLPVLKQALKPILSEVISSRFGRPDPIAIMLAPVISNEQYNGAVGGILNFERIHTLLNNSSFGRDIRYTLIDRNGNVILTNRNEQKGLAPFSWAKGSLNRLDEGISQWIPALPFNTSTIELWGKSLYVAESIIGNLSEWKLILEQPVAPFQKRLYATYINRFFLLFAIVFAALLLSEYLSRRIVEPIDQLGKLTQAVPSKFSSDQKIDWFESSVLEINNLIANFKEMADSLRAKFTENQLINESLEKRVEERTRELRESEDLLRNMIENIPAMIFMKDAENLRFIKFNRAGEELLGYSRHELLGKSDYDFFPHEQADFFAGKDREVLSSGRLVEILEEEIETRRRGKRILHTQKIPIFDKEGTPKYLLGISEDITERKRAEDALRDAEDIFKHVFESANVGKSITLPTGEVNVNRAFAELLGYSREELSNKTWQELTPPEEIEKIGKLIAPLLQGEQDSVRFTKRYVHKNGSHIWADVSAVMHRDSADQPLYFITTIIDITERIGIEEQLANSLDYIQTIFEKSPIGIATISANGQIITANHSLADIIGGTVEKIVGLNIHDIESWQTSGMLAAAQQVLRTGVEKSLDFHYFSSFGKECRVSILFVPFVHEGEQQLLLLLTDISERKRVEEEIRLSEERFSSAFHSSPAGLTITRIADGKFIDVNKSFLKMFGFSREEVIGHTSTELSMLDLQERGKLIRDQLEFGGLQDCELQARSKSGRIMQILFSSNPVELAGEACYITTMLDITERKRAEEELRKYEYIVSSARDMLALIDKDFVYLAANRAYLHGLAKTSAEVIGRKVTDLSGEEFFSTVIMPRAQRCLAGEDVRYHEWFEFPEAGRRYMDVAYSPYLGMDAEILGFVVTARDITDYENLQAQFIQAQKLESVGRLAGGVAHDYNNMLSVIIGYAELALAKVESTDPVHPDLEEILSAAKRSTNITRQLLAFARKQTIAPKVLDLNETIESMLKMLRHLIGEDIDLAWLPESGLWPVKMDPAQIDQILANLCVNARDAIAGVGKLTIETENVTFDEAYCADHAGFIPGEFVLFAVSDDGSGMDKELLDNIFEPFFTTKGVDQGTGLGLATVYGIVKQNNGFINVYSEPAQGTTFKIYLPRHVGETEKIGKESVAEIPQSRGETVLLVEDDLTILKMSKVILERLGYHVITANKPSEALLLAEKHTGMIHLLLTDVVMPEMHGRDLANQLESLYPDLKILFMSGYTANVIAHHGVLDEGVHFIHKPFSMKDLAVKLRAVMRK